MLLVRPEGITAYYAARAAMKSWGFDFGYELVGDDWKLAYPPPDPRLVELLRQVIASARAGSGATDRRRATSIRHRPKAGLSGIIRRRLRSRWRLRRRRCAATGPPGRRTSGASGRAAGAGIGRRRLARRRGPGRGTTAIRTLGRTERPGLAVPGDKAAARGSMALPEAVRGGMRAGGGMADRHTGTMDLA